MSILWDFWARVKPAWSASQGFLISSSPDFDIRQPWHGMAWHEKNNQGESCVCNSPLICKKIALQTKWPSIREVGIIRVCLRRLPEGTNANRGGWRLTCRRDIRPVILIRVKRISPRGIRVREDEVEMVFAAGKLHLSLVERALIV